MSPNQQARGSQEKKEVFSGKDFGQMLPEIDESGLGLTTLGLHHVGIVVPTEEQTATLMALLGLREAYRGFVEQYQALCIFTDGNGASQVELVVPSGGRLRQFNRGTGGLHHIALAVEDLALVAAQLSQQGMKLLEREPVHGAGPFLCNFLSPVYTKGILVEFVQEIDVEVEANGS